VSRVVVTDPDGEGHNYPGGTGANYDDQGYLVVVTGEGGNVMPLAVWAPGQWARADLVADEAPADRKVPSA
jgi:hypothetical protein